MATSLRLGDHVDRLAPLDSALGVALRDPPPLIEGDMVAAVSSLVASTPPGITPLVFHTNAVNYLRSEQRLSLVEAITSASADRRVLWLSGEGAGVLPDLPTPADAIEMAGIPIVLSDLQHGARQSTLLGIAGVQGSWIDWRLPTTAGG